jgi:hypothetical protein
MSNGTNLHRRTKQLREQEIAATGKPVPHIIGIRPGQSNPNVSSASRQAARQRAIAGMK